LKPSIGLVNLGCAKNLVDAEIMLGILYKNGYNISLDEQAADIILVNTCSFIKEAERESVSAIVRLAENGKKLIISGCLAQKYKHELMEAVPEALAVIGTGDIDNICDIVKSLGKKKKPVYSVSDIPEYSYNEETDRFQTAARAAPRWLWLMRLPWSIRRSTVRC
jgi:ribosomal protein S12 methylthiotransferase